MMQSQKAGNLSNMKNDDKRKNLIVRDLCKHIYQERKKLFSNDFSQLQDVDILEAMK